jgi:hypothetical protein
MSQELGDTGDEKIVGRSAVGLEFWQETRMAKRGVWEQRKNLLRSSDHSHADSALQGLESGGSTPFRGRFLCRALRFTPPHQHYPTITKNTKTTAHQRPSTHFLSSPDYYPLNRRTTDRDGCSPAKARVCGPLWNNREGSPARLAHSAPMRWSTAELPRLADHGQVV